MKEQNHKDKQLSRRGILPLLVSGFFIPYLGLGNTRADTNRDVGEEDEHYETFLKADGSVVRIKSKAARGARIIKKNMSNKSLLNWLNKE